MIGCFECAHTLRIALGLALVLFVGVTTSVALSGSVQEPETAEDPFAQPIAFSHAHHVTEIGLDCQMCHVYARRGPVAGIPSVETCAGCHKQVLSDQPEIQKVLEFWENKQPIPWVRVHDLPDYARFSHKRHVLVGIDCAECHGNVGQITAGSFALFFVRNFPAISMTEMKESTGQPAEADPAKAWPAPV